MTLSDAEAYCIGLGDMVSSEKTEDSVSVWKGFDDHAHGLF